MLHELALPGKDWRYNNTGKRAHLQGTDMEPVAKAWACWFVHNFESCSNVTEVIMARCYAVYAILMGEPIRVGHLIARSIKRMVTASE
ncbi:hypothetical protein A2U01_0064624, partial [Trifolium medium]|nr:hypothetical protein [Trifolium medium]